MTQMLQLTLAIPNLALVNSLTYPFVLGVTVTVPPELTNKFCRLQDLRIVVRDIRLMEKRQQNMAVGR